MAIPKTGARRISVDGQCYLWRVRHRDPEPDDRGWGWAFAAQHASRPGSTLIVNLTRRHPHWDRVARPVTPAEVADCIRRAIAAGWQPTESGGPFRMTSAAEASGRTGRAEPGASPDPVT